MMSALTTSPVNGLSELLTWSLLPQTPLWQRDALRRLCAGPDLEASDEDELEEVLKGERTAEVLSQQHIGQMIGSSPKVALKSLNGVENVNALAPKQTLSFTEAGMSIVFGENGSGKSGYVRILKSACRARLEKKFDILANIYDAAATGPQTATVGYFEGSTHRSSQWIKGAASPIALAAISVFDSAAGNIHVTGTNDIAYTPFPLLVLGRLARAADNLRARMNTEISDLEKQVPPSVTAFLGSKQSRTGRLIQTLSGKTKLEEVELLSKLSPDETSELLQLKRDFADDPATIAVRSERLAQRLDGLASIMHAIETSLNAESLQKVLDLKLDIALKREAARVDAERRFAETPIPVGSPAWKTLWEAARSFSEEAFSDKPFPATVEGEVCLLCQQSLDASATNLLLQFEAFVADEIGRQIKTCQTELDAALKFENVNYLLPSKIVEIRDFLRTVDQPALGDLISCFLIHAAWLRRWVVRAPSDSPISKAPTMCRVPALQISTTGESLRSRAKALQGTATSPERKALRERLEELTDREWLAVVKADVLKAIETKKKIEVLKLLLPQTTRTRITTHSTNLAKLLVTDRLRDRFATEASDLGISRLRVELRQEKSEAGVPRFKVCFVAKPNENVGIVLSEGEQRCLAIAAFLAELETADGHSGIVLDDPVSSLDHSFREKVANRLAREACQRQVIVFTHDIPFLSQLQQACKDAAINPLIRMVSRGGTIPGFCHNEPPTTHRSVGDAIKAIGTDLSNKRRLFDNGDPNWNECVTAFGGTLRKLWERAVEDVVSPVLTRWTHKVNTPGFLQLTALTEANHTVMRSGFGQCSIWEHYQPAAGNTSLPSADEIANEIDKLERWYGAIKAEQDTLAKRRP